MACGTKNDMLQRASQGTWHLNFVLVCSALLDASEVPKPSSPEKTKLMNAWHHLIMFDSMQDGHGQAMHARNVWLICGLKTPPPCFAWPSYRGD